MKTIDLHTHSTASDGSLSPEELVRYAKEKELAAFALTDHDTVSGLSAALAEGKRVGMPVIPGIELTCQAGEKETHIVGLGIDNGHPALLEALNALTQTRRMRNVKMVKKLSDAGIDISMEDISRFGDKPLGKAHFAAVLISRGYAKTTREAIDTYMKKGTVGYVERENISAERCISLIHEAGGLAILAHINQIGDPEAAEAVALHLKDMGLDGMEVLYSEYDKAWTAHAESIARKYALLRSGGSDFHGSFKQKLDIGTGFGNLVIPYSFLEEMQAVKKILK